MALFSRNSGSTARPPRLGVLAWAGVSILLALPLSATAIKIKSGTKILTPKEMRKLPISLDAASSEVDYKTNTVVFKDVVISQGDTKVQADHAQATGLDFVNSRWTFEGNVRIHAEQQGSLHSDQAVVEFRDNQISKATIEGSPAEFEQKRADSDLTARGHARQIVYDVSDGSVHLSKDAWLSDGRNEIGGPLLVYNIREQRVQAAAKPGTDERVHIRITPQPSDGSNKKQ
jgi:lipopolysaccharide transport protein LptA